MITCVATAALGAATAILTTSKAAYSCLPRRRPDRRAGHHHLAIRQHGRHLHRRRLPRHPFGHEVSGIAVPDLTDTVAKARANGAPVLWGPYAGQGGHSAMVRFPGGFVTEIHDGTLR
ncbi:VOC family protein [Kitasatospora sp. NPDC052896]|uniref:VOC family protein n=1 Tax=Kitasatospora sp. NPDC052896 TaxID=3364061 RepID=UPI0037CC49E7